MHVHGREAGAPRSHRRRLLAAAALTAVILVVEAIGGYVSHSLALLSDAGHMMTDLLALLLSLFGVTVALRPATDQKTYGYRRLEILTALVNGTLLVVIALYLIVQAIRRLFRPEAVDAHLMLKVAIVGLIANLIGIALLSPSRRNLNVHGALLHMMGDALSSLGVIAGALVIRFTGWTPADGVISLAIGAVILWGAARLMREASDILLEGVPRGVAVAELQRAMQSVEGVVAIHDLHVWSITSGMPALSGHVVAEDGFLEDSDELLNGIKRVLEERFGICHTTLQLESERYQEVGDMCR